MLTIDHTLEMKTATPSLSSDSNFGEAILRKVLAAKLPRGKPYYRLERPAKPLGGISNTGTV